MYGLQELLKQAQAQDSPPEETATPALTAQDHILTADVEKLAAAVEYATPFLFKGAAAADHPKTSDVDAYDASAPGLRAAVGALLGRGVGTLVGGSHSTGVLGAPVGSHLMGLNATKHLSAEDAARVQQAVAAGAALGALGSAAAHRMPGTGSPVMEAVRDAVAVGGPSVGAVIGQQLGRPKKASALPVHEAKDGPGLTIKDLGGATQKPAATSTEKERGIPTVSTNASQHIPGHQEVALAKKAKALYASYKRASDEMNEGPSAHAKATQPTVSASLQNPPPKARDGELVDSIARAISMKPKDGFKSQREDLKSYFKEPAQTASTAPILQRAFEHTSEAGPKTASATEAARSLLASLSQGGK